MDFAVPETIRALLPRVRELVREELFPLEGELQRRPFAELRPLLEEKRLRARELGLFAPHMPKEHGGAGLRLLEFAFLAEELGRSPLGHYVFNCQAPDAGNMEVLLAQGTPEQKRRFLEPLVRGEVRSCFTMTEPEHAGSNPVWLSTTARRDGDGWVIDGHKWFATGAEGAAFALCMAVTRPDAPLHERASLFIVPTDAPGFERVRNTPVMGHTGSDWMSHAEVRYRACRVPEGNLLGAEGRGFAIAQERLGPGRIHHAMRWIGICERALELMCARAVAREIAPATPLASRQAVQHWIAESRAEIDAARLLVLRAAWRIETEGARAAREDVSLLKFFAADVLQRVVDRALQAHGALGLTDATPLAFWYAHERAARIYDGPDEVHKTVVARRVLREHGFSVES